MKFGTDGVRGVARHRTHHRVRPPPWPRRGSCPDGVERRSTRRRRWRHPRVDRMLDACARRRVPRRRRRRGVARRRAHPDGRLRGATSRCARRGRVGLAQSRITTTGSSCSRSAGSSSPTTSSSASRPSSSRSLPRGDRRSRLRCADVDGDHRRVRRPRAAAPSRVAASTGCASCSTRRTVLHRVVGPEVLRAAGADVIVIARSPGRAQHQRRMRRHGSRRTSPRRCCEHGADVGVALDGDADRLIAVDHTGSVVDGDHIIAIVAADLLAKGELRDDTVVVTVMTNLGFRLAMREAGINVVETAVGDRYVLEALAAGGYSLGGEQSRPRHLRRPCHDRRRRADRRSRCSTPSRRSGRPLAELSSAAMTSLPQVLVNVVVARRRPGRRRRARRRDRAVERSLGWRRPGPRSSERHRAARPGDGRGADARCRTGRRRRPRRASLRRQLPRLRGPVPAARDRTGSGSLCEPCAASSGSSAGRRRGPTPDGGLS